MFHRIFYYIMELFYYIIRFIEILYMLFMCFMVAGTVAALSTVLLSFIKNLITGSLESSQFGLFEDICLYTVFTAVFIQRLCKGIIDITSYVPQSERHRLSNTELNIRIPLSKK